MKSPEENRMRATSKSRAMNAATQNVRMNTAITSAIIATTLSGDITLNIAAAGAISVYTGALIGRA